MILSVFKAAEVVLLKTCSFNDLPASFKTTAWFWWRPGVEGWIENPYWQLFSGEHELQWSAPVASSDLTHFRKRIGKKGAERLLKLSVDLFHPKIKEEEVVVDITVQEKNITFPTDAKLAKKVIDTCRKIANKEDISLSQSYICTE